MKKLPDLSLIIPTYNAECSIERLLTSIAAQDIPKLRIEVILIDDCSTDKTVEIIQCFVKKKQAAFQIQLQVLKQNCGNGNAKNLGVHAARADIVFFLDDHSYLLDKKTLQKVVELFQEPGTDAICGHYQSSQQTDFNIIRDLRRKYVYKKVHARPLSLEHWSTFSIVAGAAKKSVLEHCPFPENFGQHSAEDTYWQIVATNAGYQFRFSPEIFVFHDHNLSFGELLKKTRTELDGTGDLIASFAERHPEYSVPHLAHFLDYNVAILVLLIGAFFSSILLALLVLWYVASAFGLFRLVQNEATVSMRTKVFFASFLPLIQLAKTVYLPLYLWMRYPTIQVFGFFLKVVWHWNVSSLFVFKRSRYAIH